MQEYTHIVNGKVQKISIPHPLENQRNKSEFINRLVNQLGHNTILDNRDLKNLCYIVNDDFQSYVYVEHMDGGGMDVRKKISIPPIGKSSGLSSIKNQMYNIVNEGLPILIINEYVPLEIDSNNNVSLSKKSVYTIIDPEEFYKSKVVQEQNGNASSRWVSIEDIYRCYTSNVIMMNQSDNVHIVPSTKMFSFLKKLLKGEKTERFSFNRSKFSKKIQYHAQTEHVEEVLNEDLAQKQFREGLMVRSKCRCEICGSSYPLDAMKASHTYPREYIRNDESLNLQQKFDMISDINNGLFLCPLCDAVYDKYYLTFDKYWKMFVDVENYVKKYEGDESQLHIHSYLRNWVGRVVLKEYLRNEKVWKYMQMRNRLVIEKMKKSFTPVDMKGFELI